VTTLQTFTLFELLAGLALGGLMAYRFSKRDYTRISEVARKMAALGHVGIDGGNEFMVLRDAVAATLDWKAQVDSDLRRNGAAMRQDFIRRLLRARFGSEEEELRSLADFGIVPLSPYHAVFVVLPEEVPEGAERTLEAGKLLAAPEIATAVEAILERSHRGFVAEYEGTLVCIASLKLPSATDWGNDLEDMVAETRRYLAGKLSIEATVGVSSIASGMETIPRSFHEAMEALEYRLVAGPGSTIRYPEVAGRKPLYRCPLEIEQQLHNAVRVGDEARADRLLEAIWRKNFREGEVSVQGLKCFLFDMYNLLSKAVATLEEAKQREVSEIIQPLMGAFSAVSSLPELEREVRRVVLEVCGAMRGIKKDDRLAFEIREFVQRDHTDLNLSIRLIADRFGLSQGYLSKVFRDSTGQGLLDFIAEARIVHAKKLIASGRTSLEEVAVAVGYMNANALIRSFKKREGVTPGRYRDLSAGAESGAEAAEPPSRN
jgi:two-component system, response regulator YesN